MQESALLTILVAAAKSSVYGVLDRLLQSVRQHWRFEWLEMALDGRPEAQPLGSSEDDLQAPWLREHASWALDPYLGEAESLKTLLGKALTGRRWPWMQMLLEQAMLLPPGVRGAVLPQAVATLDVHSGVGALPALILGQLLSAGLKTVSTRPDARHNLLHAAFVSGASPEVVELILQRTEGKDMGTLLAAQVGGSGRGPSLGFRTTNPTVPR